LADIAKSGTPSLASVLPPANAKVTGLLAGENIAAGDMCYVKASDTRIWRSIGTTLGAAAAKTIGIAAEAAKAGQPCTLYHDVNFNYGQGLTPGTALFVGAAAGALADAATTGGTGVVGYVIDATRIYVMPSRY
jgi:hypothetical protein